MTLAELWKKFERGWAQAFFGGDGEAAPGPAAAEPPSAVVLLEKFTGEAAFWPVAQRVCWFKSPDEVLARPHEFLCRLMAIGPWADILLVREAVGDEPFRDALRRAQPGILSAKDWIFWHQRLFPGQFPPGEAPPMPRRGFLSPPEGDNDPPLP